MFNWKEIYTFIETLTEGDFLRMPWPEKTTYLSFTEKILLSFPSLTRYTWTTHLIHSSLNSP